MDHPFPQTDGFEVIRGGFSNIFNPITLDVHKMVTHMLKAIAARFLTFVRPFCDTRCYRVKRKICINKRNWWL